jgi:hypothetical protein
MRNHLELSEELHAIPEYTTIVTVKTGGERINAAIRVRDLEGELGWALAGFGEPWTSDKLAAAIIAAKADYLVVDHP